MPIRATIYVNNVATDNASPIYGARVGVAEEYLPYMGLPPSRALEITPNEIVSFTTGPADL